MTVRIITGDCREVLPTLPADSFDCVVTSPPYFGLRDYGVDGQIGLEPTLAAYLETMVDVMREVRRVMKPSATCWLNVGSSYHHTNPSGPQGKTGQRASRTFTAEGAGGVRDSGPTQSHQPSRVPAYGSGGKGQQSSLAPDLPCSGLDDGRLSGFPIHRGHIPDSGQPLERSLLRAGSTSLDSGHQGCEPALAPSFHLPIGLSSLRNALGASYREATALVETRPETSFLGARASVRRAAYTCDTVENGSASRTMSRDASERACYCDSCGICFVYLATKCLKFKAKDLILVPDLLALALQADGWFLRSEIVWSKPSPMPESVRDRPTCAHEKVWLLTKSAKYYFDADAISEGGSGKCPGNKTYKYDGVPGHETKQGILKQSNIPQTSRNARNVWSIASEPYRGAHYAVMPSTLAERCIKAGRARRGVARTAGDLGNAS